MAKFGELINLEEPVLIFFYRGVEDPTMMEVLNEVALEVQEEAKIIKIDVDKNGKLSEALKIEAIPTVVIYKKGHMVWRDEKDLSTENLLQLLQEYR